MPTPTTISHSLGQLAGSIAARLGLVDFVGGVRTVVAPTPAFDVDAVLKTIERMTPLLAPIFQRAGVDLPVGAPSNPPTNGAATADVPSRLPIDFHIDIAAEKPFSIVLDGGGTRLVDSTFAGVCQRLVDYVAARSAQAAQAYPPPPPSPDEASDSKN